ncbi:hypothetical protein CspHIS471_0511570 [Cutaneotrichosporon sp. HIS471]|nr:hypothetical protein CspHIS471_0511570 [Cutaneotrichosporon sp. HIS471]
MRFSLSLLLPPLAAAALATLASAAVLAPLAAAALAPIPPSGLAATHYSVTTSVFRVTEDTPFVLDLQDVLPLPLTSAVALAIVTFVPPEAATWLSFGIANTLSGSVPEGDIFVVFEAHHGDTPSALVIHVQPNDSVHKLETAGHLTIALIFALIAVVFGATGLVAWLCRRNQLYGRLPYFSRHKTVSRSTTRTAIGQDSVVGHQFCTGIELEAYLRANVMPPVLVTLVQDWSSARSSDSMTAVPGDVPPRQGGAQAPGVFPPRGFECVESQTYSDAASGWLVGVQKSRKDEEILRHGMELLRRDAAIEMAGDVVVTPAVNLESALFDDSPTIRPLSALVEFPVLALPPVAIVREDPAAAVM